MESSKVPKDYWRLWKEKFFSLFVSGKMILFVISLGLSTVLLALKLIDQDNWRMVVITAITVIAGFRGIVEIANIRENGTKQKYKDLFGEIRKHLRNRPKDDEDPMDDPQGGGD